MKITIDIVSGNNNDVTKSDIDKNIESMNRVIDGKMLACDVVLLISTKSLLQAIKKELPEQ